MKKPKIAVVGVGVGNFGSVINIIKNLNHSADLVTSPNLIAKYDKIILPGVGNFDEGMLSLNKTGIADELKNLIINKKIPILGICLGMQLLCAGSEEGELSGMGFLDVMVKKFRFTSTSKLKVPHMGWNNIDVLKKNSLILKSQNEYRYYFAHSYFLDAVEDDYCIASADYGHKFCAAINKENIYGVQFHPEKSHSYGLELMKNFLEIV